MGKRKRAKKPTSLVGRAVSAGRRALKEAESRIPPDLRRQLDRSLKDADKTARAAIKTLQAQVKRATTRADVNSVLKRIDDLTRQARQIATGAGSRPATPRRRAATTRRTTTRTKKPAAGARRSATPARRPAPRRTRRTTPSAPAAAAEAAAPESSETTEG